ncbi:MAG: hypothetical protein J2P57_01490 [Acidimicrobiaceae bacterium]|nr:hypothetical protein [Acidimicrobiaceae bacterium]
MSRVDARPFGKRLLGSFLVVLVVTAAACGGSSPQAVGGRSPRQMGAQAEAVASGAPQPVCPASTFPTSPTDHTPYALAFKADITGGTVRAGYNEDTTGVNKPKGGVYIPWQLVVSNIIGVACGLIEIPSLTIDIAPAGVVIYGNRAHIAVVVNTWGSRFQISGFRLKVQIDSPGLDAFVSGVRPNGLVDAEATDAHASAVLSASNPYLVCPAHVVIPELTTGTMTTVPVGRGPSPVWTVTGTPVKANPADGPILGATATVVSNDFNLGPFTKTSDPNCGGSPSHPNPIFGAVFNAIIGGINSQGKEYNPLAFQPGAFRAGAPPGEAQASLSIKLTSVDLPARRAGG